jgi:hypothetical protein
MAEGMGVAVEVLASEPLGEAGRRSGRISWIEGSPVGALVSPRVSG